jgi:trehalose 6-phosphate synthase/phosphatase
MRLIIVSNRLPLHLSSPTGQKEPQRSIGGLATGIEAYTEEISRGNTVFSDFLWIGWPGAGIKPEEQPVLRQELMERYKYCPVFLDQEVTEGFYGNYCNKVLWPLFHYFPSNVDRNQRSWYCYEEANRIFYETLKQEIREGDFVWIHDYHLMLLPALLRHDFPDISISFFLHIPFPAFDIFRQLPGKEQAALLNGLLGADTLALHIEEYKHHLLNSYREVLHLDDVDHCLSSGNRKTKVLAFPMGICYREIAAMAASGPCREDKKLLRKQFGGRKVILSVDRLDYTKGIVNRLLAFQDFLLRYPAWRSKVVMVLIVAPSRREIEAYSRIRNEIDQLAGRINGEFGDCSWTPIIYQYRQFDLAGLCALYGACDLALVTPLRDGMNLIAKEFVATSNSRRSALVLSEFAGAAAELSEAIIINPYNVEALSNAIHTGLTMPAAEKYKRSQRMKKKLASYDVLKWAADIVFFTAAMNRQENGRAPAGPGMAARQQLSATES